MFATDAMEFGVFPFDFPVPKGFEGAYPVRCGYQCADTPFAAGEEDLAALIYILQGEGAVSRAGESSNFFSGCMIAAENARELVIYPAENTEYLFVVLQNAGWQISRACMDGFVHEVSGGRADRLLGRLCYHASTQKEQSVYAVSADVYTLLMELCALCAPHRPIYPPLVRQAVELMREEYAYLSGVEELAERMEVSTGHLIRAFSTAVGVPPGKFLLRLKLDNARLMLQNRDYSVDMVADMAGFSGANYFCKVFRRETGESPGQYRARHLARPALDPESQKRLEEIEQKAHL